MWNYAYKLNNLVLSTVATSVRVEVEGGGSFPDTGVRIPGRDGVHVDTETAYGPLILTLRTLLRYTSSTGTITHSDGAAGHVYENFSKIKKELAKPAVLSRTAPHVGAVEARNVRLITDPVPSDIRIAFLWSLLVPEGTWRDSAESTATGTPPSVTTKGDRAIPDPVLIFSAAGEFEYTAGDGTEYTVTASSGPTYPVTIDVGAGTVVDDNAADARSAVEFSHPSWMRLDPGSALSLTSTVETTLKWRNRWA